MLTRGFASVALFRPELRPEPAHRAIGALPLIFVDGARQEALDSSTLGGHASADHFGDRTGDHDTGQIWVERLMGATHGALRAMPAELFLGKSGDDYRQFMRR